MNIEEFAKKELNKTEVEFKEKYGVIIKKIGIENLIEYLPATKEKIRKALAKDKHLNNIPINLWDKAGQSFKYKLQKIGVTSFSLCNLVCILKETARLYIEEM